MITILDYVRLGETNLSNNREIHATVIYEGLRLATVCDSRENFIFYT
jgi:hypothetical protein